MATTFIEGIAVRPGRTPLITAKDSIDYITNPEKTRNGELVSSFRCSPDTAHFEIMMEQHEYEQQTGRKVIQDYKGEKQSYMLMTMRQSFAPGEVTPEQAHEIGCKLAQRFLGEKYQYVVATHVNSHCIHNHITYNIVGSDLKKFRQTKYTHKHLADISDKLCKEYGLVVVVPSPEWQKRKYTNEKQTSFREILKTDIDQAIDSSKSYDEFIKIMEENYRFDDNGKYLKFRHRTNGQQRYIRSYTLGSAYTVNNILARISGQYVERSNQIETGEEEIQALSYSQHLRNIKAMVSADKFVSDYGSDFSNQLTSISSKAEEVQEQIKTAMNQLTKAESILKCFDAIDMYGSVANEYQTALLKERFEQSHKGELNLYYTAVAALKQNNIDMESTGKERFAMNLSEIQSGLSNLQIEYDSLQSQIDQVNQVRKVIEKVQDGEQILTERKRGKNYGR
jgi:hypothetical protein